MNTDTETTICEGEGCGVPIEQPKVQQINPFLAFRPSPLWKDCLLKMQTEHFQIRHRVCCPYKLPHWRPKV
jgi:hypothetical protein